jgi:hypothetical protein
MNKHDKRDMSFDQWFRMLGRIAEEQYGFDVSGGESSWKDFYDDGYSPREALDEDTYAGI